MFGKLIRGKPIRNTWKDIEGPFHAPEMLVKNLEFEMKRAKQQHADGDQ